MTFTQTPIVFLINSIGVFIIHMHNSFVVCEENGGFRIEKRRFTSRKRRFTGRKTAFYENKTAVFNLKNGGLGVGKRRFMKTGDLRNKRRADY